jgi:hypothetical protein
MHLLGHCDSGEVFSSFFKKILEVLGFELRAYTLSHSASPPLHFVLGIFEIGLPNYLLGLDLNHDPLDLCHLSS